LAATPANTARSWRFGLFEVDAQKEELRRSGVPVKMREQPFRILVFLLEHAGEIVTREDLRRVLWPADTFVDFDHSLNTAVMKLREALGDTADKPLYIETVPKRGYRFIAPVSIAADPRNGAVSLDGDSPVRETNADNVQSQSAAAKVSFPGQRTSRLALVGGLALLAVVAALFVVWKRHLPILRRDAAEASSNFHIVPVTNAPGLAWDPALSPDGREIAYARVGPGEMHPALYVSLVGSDNPLQITAPKSGFTGGTSWSPDGRVIAFARCDSRNTKDGAVYLAPALGGPERKLTNVGCEYNMPSPLAWSADGERILMVDRCSASGPFGLVVFALATGEKQCLTDAGPPSFERRHAFSLSPDGSTVAFIPSIDSSCEIYTVPLSGGTPQRVVKDEDTCDGLMWTPDGRSIVISSERSTQPSLWRVSSTGGEMQRETLFPALGSFSKDGRRLVYSEPTSSEPLAIWRADLTSAGGQVVSNKKLISTQFPEVEAQPSPDGARVVWSSGRGGTAEIWVSDATGEHPMPLTHLNQYSGTPRWSPDGKWIAFDSYSNKEVQIYIVDSEGRNLRVITRGAYPNVVPSWSRDGKWIYFSSKRTGRMEAWKHSLESGEELQVTRDGGFNPHESNDGRSVYFAKFDEAGIWSVPSRGGAERLVVPDKPQVLYWGHWALTETGLYLLNAEAEPRTRIEFYDLGTNRISTILTLEKRPASGHPSLSATADGKTIFYSQWDQQSVIKMVEFSK
jgi:Tol biopolymer transport system component/DNA-binding winged helix-turn-helix (wHTH) protein